MCVRVDIYGSRSGMGAGRNTYIGIYIYRYTSRFTARLITDLTRGFSRWLSGWDGGAEEKDSKRVKETCCNSSVAAVACSAEDKE